LIRSIQIFQFI